MTSPLEEIESICLSGGAEGADLQFGMCAGTVGHHVVHWSFSGHRSKAPPSEIVVLDAEQLAEADERLVLANRTLKRRFPSSNPFVDNLLRRNWFQVRDAEAIYAVSLFDREQVKGGTAWAVQMFLDRAPGEAVAAYVFDQIEGVWFTFVGDGWARIDDPPSPHGIYAGVGTRDLNALGKAAVRRLYGLPTGPMETT